jgi:hypothetical protein
VKLSPALRATAGLDSDELGIEAVWPPQELSARLIAATARDVRYIFTSTSATMGKQVVCPEIPS